MFKGGFHSPAREAANRFYALNEGKIEDFFFTIVVVRFGLVNVEPMAWRRLADVRGFRKGVWAAANRPLNAEEANNKP